MTTVDTEVACVLCGGEASESFDCNTGYVSYFCNSCGYCTNTEASAHPKKTMREFQESFRPFFKWAEFIEDGGAVIEGKMLWWPGALQVVTQYSIVPVVVSGKLKWRRTDIEEIPESERIKHPRDDGFPGYYEYREAGYCADYDTFREAREATRGDNLARALKQSTKRLEIKALGAKRHGR